jgi:hypothetical protein
MQTTRLDGDGNGGGKWRVCLPLGQLGDGILPGAFLARSQDDNPFASQEIVFQSGNEGADWLPAFAQVNPSSQPKRCQASSRNPTGSGGFPAAPPCGRFSRVAGARRPTTARVRRADGSGGAGNGTAI